MQDLSCRLCGNGETRLVLSLRSAPRNIQRLLRKQDLARDSSIDLEVMSCTRCGFVQLPPVLESDYYDDYLMRANHSNQMEQHQSQQARNFVERFGLAGKKVIEVGCGEGSGMRHLAAAGVQVFGVEPSRPLREIAVSAGLQVQDAYVTPQGLLEHGPFDAFVSRQVLEHVPDIHGFLTGVRRNLADGAVGLIEVPSLEKALRDRRYYDFFSDHVNYFSLDTLRCAVELNGFTVLDSFHAMFDEYNVVLVKALSMPDLAEVQRTSVDLAADIRSFVREHHASGKKVGVWGAGGKGLSVLASLGIKGIDLLVDSDPFKQGLYTPVSHILVQAPTIEAITSLDAIIVTAMAFKSEIEQQLRHVYRFRGTIAFLGRQLEYL